MARTKKVVEKTETIKIESVRASEKPANKGTALKGVYKSNEVVELRHGAGSNQQLMLSIPKNTPINCEGYYNACLGVKWLYVSVLIGNVKYMGYANINLLTQEG